MSTKTAPDKTIVEGSATMCYPADQESTVFYNPVQVQNRDLSILMITLYQERRAERLKNDHKSPPQGLTILDALAASGLRSIRYWKEISNIKHITVNDLEQAAVERAHANIVVNQLQDCLVNENETRPHGICIHHGDALQQLYSSRQSQWDVVDLDPYGSAAPFLDAAIQGVQHSGMLCVTCTDMVALGGSHPDTCFGRYASIPIPRAGYLQEVALRILLYALASTAARYGRTIKPILSVGMDFYVRVFVEVYNDKAGVNTLSLQVGHVYQSTQCPSFHMAPAGQLGGKKGKAVHPGRAPAVLQCEETGSAFKIGGPLWLGPLHDQAVVGEALKRLESTTDTVLPAMKWIATRQRLQGLLTSCHEELPDVPLYYRVPDLAKTIHVTSPPLQQFKAALVNAGYRVSGYHKEPQAIKTNAPNSVVWDIMRAWCRKHAPGKTHKAGSTAEKILAVEPSITVDFTLAQKKKTAKGVARFPQNPQANWGPKPKASGHKRKAEEKETEE